MKFVNMGAKPLAFDVKVGRKVVIPKGTTGVKIAFRASPITYVHPETGKTVCFNVYMYKGKCYHAA
mgnify:CR=1 FL=1|jgi:hypothetical protein